MRPVDRVERSPLGPEETFDLRHDRLGDAGRGLAGDQPRGEAVERLELRLPPEGVPLALTHPPRLGRGHGRHDQEDREGDEIGRRRHAQHVVRRHEQEVEGEERGAGRRQRGAHAREARHRDDDRHVEEHHVSRLQERSHDQESQRRRDDRRGSGRIASPD